MTQVIDVSQLATKGPELLATVKAGGEVILTDQNVPQARLLPLGEPKKRKAGLHQGNFQMSPDFDDLSQTISGSAKNEIITRHSYVYLVGQQL